MSAMFLLKRRFLTVAVTAFCTLIGAESRADAPAFSPEHPATLRIGIMGGEDEDIWQTVKQNAAKRGLNLKIVSFSDYNQPNQALAERDIDANAFEHQPFLEAQNKTYGFHITRAGDTYFQPIGLYSVKYRTPAEIPRGAAIAIPSDPSNEGRALNLLQNTGLIRLNPDAGLFATQLDIADNPKHLKIRELDPGLVARALPDVAAVVANTDWARKAGIDLEKSRIAAEGLENNPYINFIAVNTRDINQPWVKPLVESFQQSNVRQKIMEAYHGVSMPGWKVQ